MTSSDSSSLEPTPPSAPPTPSSDQAPQPPAAVPQPPVGAADVAPAAPYPSSAAPYPSSAAPYPSSTTPYPSSAAPYPISASPYGLAPAPVKPRLSPWIWVLAGVSALLLVGAGSVGFLYLDSRATNDKQIADRAAQIEELTKDVHDLQQRSDELSGALAQATDGVQVSKAQLEELATCPDALTALFGTDPDSAAFAGAVRAMFDACDVDI